MKTTQTLSLSLLLTLIYDYRGCLGKEEKGLPCYFCPDCPDPYTPGDNIAREPEFPPVTPKVYTGVLTAGENQEPPDNTCGLCTKTYTAGGSVNRGCKVNALITEEDKGCVDEADGGKTCFCDQPTCNGASRGLAGALRVAGVLVAGALLLTLFL